MKITVFGAGYVGLVSGACLSDMGNHVLCLDVDAHKVRALQQGQLPIHEPGLLEVVQRNASAGRLEFTTDLDRAVAHGTLIFLALPTPPAEDGSADLQHVLAAAHEIGQRMTDYKVVIDKSTVPVGTADRVRALITAELATRGMALDFSVVSNPEFLKEGAAVQDFARPDRVVVGVLEGDERAEMLLRALYAPFVRNRDRLLVMGLRSAELTKYAANAMLATRISFMNEMAALAEALGADIEAVRGGIGSDPRIGTHFLYAGAGYGGSCFPKDIQALAHSAASVGLPGRILAAVEQVNDAQKQVLARKIVASYGEDLSGRTFAVWGLAFKPETDDMRGAPSRVLIAELLRRGARVQAYDPVATDTAVQALAEDLGADPREAGVVFAHSAMDALEGADALAIVTEWKEFRTPDFDAMARALRDRRVFDGRNLYEPAMARHFGLEVQAIGRGAAATVIKASTEGF
jgi:UDPglucose 6-dehydrogenase